MSLIISILTETFDEVLKWFPGIDVRFAVQCGKCDKRNHFIPLPSLPCASSNPTILCQKNNQVKLLPAQFWFYTQELARSVAETEEKITDFEIGAIAQALDGNKVTELVVALEMSEQAGGAEGNPRVLLSRWQKEMVLMGIPARPHLLMQLQRIGMKDLHAKLLHQEFHKQPSLEQEEMKVAYYPAYVQVPPMMPPYYVNMDRYSGQGIDPTFSVQVTPAVPYYVNSSFFTQANYAPSATTTPFYMNSISSPLNVPTMSISEQDFDRSSRILRKYSHKWREIGLELGFKGHELDCIHHSPILLSTAPNSFLDTMLSSWRQWAPGDHRGSTKFATLDSLRTAVDRAGLGMTAQEL